MIRARDLASPALYIIHDSKSRKIRKMVKNISQTMLRMLPKATTVSELSVATNIIILLSKNVLRARSTSLRDILMVTSELRRSMLTFVYINEGEHSWDWSLPSKVEMDDSKKKQDFQASICGREAYVAAFSNVNYIHSFTL